MVEKNTPPMPDNLLVIFADGMGAEGVNAMVIGKTGAGKTGACHAHLFLARADVSQLKGVAGEKLAETVIQNTNIRLTL